jgi:hypothetical protein
MSTDKDQDQKKIIKLDQSLFSPAGVIASGKRKSFSKKGENKKRSTRNHTTLGKNAIIKHLNEIKSSSFLNSPLSDTHKTESVPSEFDGAKAFFDGLKPIPPVTIPVKNEIANQHLDENNFPNYGCLKGGNLPTFRRWKTTLRRNSQLQEHANDIVQNSRLNTGQPSSLTHSTPLNQISIHLGDSLNDTKVIEANGVIPLANPIVSTAPVSTILKRRYTLGKKTNVNQVAVLIPNNSTRKKIAREIQDFANVPISEVKEFLQKKGLIKTSAIAPNEKILRYMFENTKLIGGDVINKNYSNLLQNYLHKPTGKDL